MNQHKPVSRLRWQASLKLILLKWRNKDLSSERQRIEGSMLETIQSCAEAYPEHASALEIGGGPLCISRLLTFRNKTYLDPLIDDFRRLFPGELPEEAEYLATTAEHINKPASHYELILCLNMISHSLNPELIMHEIERLLKPHGTLILSIRTHSPIEARLHYWALQYVAFLCRKTRPYYYSAIGIRRTLERHFDIIDENKRNARAVWLPFFKRERYVFVCQHKQSSSANPA
ncbi:MAG: methyltransferase domain-containing protein [Mariprofundus sp.]|nr:methyltransferase domain-containing protein [Mariprofundus sp.]